MKKIIITTLIFFVFYIIGFLSYDTIEEFILDFVRTEVIHTKIYVGFRNSLKFGLILSLIPMFISGLLSNKFLNIKNIVKIFLIIFSLMFVTVCLRIIYLNSLVYKINNTAFEIDIVFDSDSLNFPFYMFIGQIIGFIVSFIVIKKNNFSSKKIQL